MPSLYINIYNYINNVKTMLFSVGDTIYTTGDDEYDTIYFILRGEVEIIKETDEGEVVIERLTQGEFFGEYEFIHKKRREYTARAGSNLAKLGTLEMDMFMKLCVNKPDFLYNFMLIIIGRLSRYDDAIATAMTDIHRIMARMEDQNGNEG